MLNQHRLTREEIISIRKKMSSAMKKKNLPGMDLSRIIRLPGLGNILNKRKILVGNGGFLAKLPEAIRLGICLLKN